MKFSMKKHDIPLIAIIARQAASEQICRQVNGMLVSSVDRFRMIIRRIQTVFFEDRLDIPN